MMDGNTENVARKSRRSGSLRQKQSVTVKHLMESPFQMKWYEKVCRIRALSVDAFLFLHRYTCSLYGLYKDMDLIRLNNP
jgi:hypothetical protein